MFWKFNQNANHRLDGPWAKNFQIASTPLKLRATYETREQEWLMGVMDCAWLDVINIWALFAGCY